MYVIERKTPEVGALEREALREAAYGSNGVRADMKAENKNIQWEHRYLAGDRTFCLYLADDEGLIHEHAERRGFPSSVVSATGRRARAARRRGYMHTAMVAHVTTWTVR